jgi:membrane-bound metal-dependent hydrolase YbcI (DUF457 family)
VATPVGHAIIGAAVGYRLGARTPAALLAAAMGGCLPDIDLAISHLLHGDPWKLHRKATHTPGFAMSAGMLGGFAGLLGAGSVEGERDRIADGMAGAAIVGSHLLLDQRVLPYVSTPKDGKGRMRNECLNVAIDLLVYAPIAWVLTRSRARDRRT